MESFGFREKIKSQEELLKIEIFILLNKEIGFIEPRELILLRENISILIKNQKQNTEEFNKKYIKYEQLLEEIIDQTKQTERSKQQLAIPVLKAIIFLDANDIDNYYEFMEEVYSRAELNANSNIPNKEDFNHILDLMEKLTKI